MASYTRTLSRFSRCFRSLTPADLHFYQRPKQRPKSRSVAALRSLSRCRPRSPRPAPHPHSTPARAPVHRISSPTAPIRPPRTHGRFGRCPPLRPAALRRSARTNHVPRGAAPPPGLTRPNCGPPPARERPSAAAGTSPPPGPASPPRTQWSPGRHLEAGGEQSAPRQARRGAVPGLVPVGSRKSSTPPPTGPPALPGSAPRTAPGNPFRRSTTRGCRGPADRAPFT